MNNLKNCPTDDSLVQFHLGTLREPGLSTVAEHTETCPVCEARLRELDNKPDAVLAALQAPLADTPRLEQAAPAEDPRLALRAAGYEVLSELGRGGMGVVYLAREIALDREVAVKVLAQLDPSLATRFRAEAEALARLSHPNVVQVHAVGGGGGCPFLVMEYVRGGDLGDRLAGQPLAESEAARLLLGLAAGVAASHAAGVIHRDLKPRNVLLATDGTPKVTDFGLAMRSDNDPGLTRSGCVAGTPSYMAPEQAQARRDRIGPATDVWALGAILYECLTGRPPFLGDTALEVLGQVIDADPVPPSRLRPGLSRDLETVCLKCLAKEPERRYLTAEALAADIARFRKGHPVTARRAGPVERAWKLVRRRPAAAALVAVLAVGVPTALGVVSWLWRDAVHHRGLADANAGREADARRDAEAAWVQAATDRDDARFEARRANTARYAMQLALAKDELARGDFDRAAATLLTCDPDLRHLEYDSLWAQVRVRTLRSVGREVLCVAFSPDGRRVASGGAARSVHVRDAVTGEVVFEARHAAGVNDLAYSPDGKLLVTSSVSGWVQLWDAESGKSVRGFWHSNLVGMSRMTRRVEFSPDGRWLASVGTDRLVRLWNLSTGEPAHALEGHQADVVGVAFLPGGGELASVGADGVLWVWEVATGRLIRKHSVGGPCHGLAASGEGKCLAVGMAGAVQLRSADGAMLLRSLTVQGAGLAHTVAFGPGGRRLAAAFRGDSVVRVWDLSGGEPATLRGHSGEVGSIAFSPDGQSLASGGADRTVKLWSLSPQAVTRLVGLPSPFGLAFSPDGRRLATASLDNTLRVWDTETLRPAHPPTILEESVGLVAIAYSPDGHRLAGRLGDGSVRVWDASTRRELARSGPTPRQSESLAFSPDGKSIAVANHLDPVAVLDAATATRSFVLPRPAGQAGLRVAYSPDGKLLAEAVNDKVILWDIADRREARTLQGANGWVLSLAFSPDGVQLAGGCRDGVVRVWEVQSGQNVFALRGHAAEAFGVCYSPDGRRLVSAGGDRVVRIWDSATGQDLMQLEGHAGPAYCVAFSPAGRLLASGGGDKTLRLWGTAVAYRSPKLP